MRKLMLAGAAMLGATSGIASAQAPVTVGAEVMTTPSQGTMALPWAQGPAANNTNNAYGSPSTYQGRAVFGGQHGPSMDNGFSACDRAETTCNSATAGADPTRW
jgi:hypothetical protein